MKDAADAWELTPPNETGTDAAIQNRFNTTNIGPGSLLPSTGFYPKSPTQGYEPGHTPKCEPSDASGPLGGLN
jgi:hypothetical protein